MSSENSVPQGAIQCEVHEELDSLRPKGGYSVLSEHTFICNSCNSKLVKVMVIKETKEVNKVKVKCVCGGYSFVKKFTGKTMTCPCPGFTISDIQGVADSQVIEVMRENE